MISQTYIVLLLMMYCISRSPLHAGKPHHCQQQNSSYTDLEWDWEPATLSVECNGRSNRLHCCVQHYTSIQWFERVHQTDKWTPFKEEPGIRYVVSDDLEYINQTVFFRNISDPDAHEYMCVIRDSRSGKTLKNIVEMRVLYRGCSQYNQGAIMLEPEVDNSVVPAITNEPPISAQIGENIELNCLAFLGDTSDVKLITWLKRYLNGTKPDFEVFHEDKSKRIYYENKTSLDGKGVESFLHIRNVTKEDFKANFTCAAYNGWDPAPEVYFSLKHAKPPETIESKMLHVAGPVLGASIMTLILGGIFGFTQRRNLKLINQKRKNKYRTPKAPEKTSLLQGDLLNGYPIMSDSTGLNMGQDKSWTLPPNCENLWLQADFGETRTINAVSVTSESNAEDVQFKLAFSSDKETWYQLKGGNEDQNDGMYTCKSQNSIHLHQNVAARYVRLYPLNIERGTTLNWNISGWEDGVTLMYPCLPAVPESDHSLGEKLHNDLEQRHALFSSRDVLCGEPERTIIGATCKKSACVIVVISEEIIKGMFTHVENNNDDEPTEKQNQRPATNDPSLGRKTGAHRDRESAKPLLGSSASEIPTPCASVSNELQPVITDNIDGSNQSVAVILEEDEAMDQTDDVFPVNGEAAEPLMAADVAVNVNHINNSFPLNKDSCRIYNNLVLSIYPAHLCKVIFILRSNNSTPIDWSKMHKLCASESDEIRKTVKDLEVLLKSCKSIEWDEANSFTTIESAMKLPDEMAVVSASSPKRELLQVFQSNG